MKRQITGTPRRRSLCRRPDSGRNLSRSGATSLLRRQAQKPYYTLGSGHSRAAPFRPATISSRLYCNPKALWKLNWFLRDFGYDVELLGRDEVDETSTHRSERSSQDQSHYV